MSRTILMFAGLVTLAGVACTNDESTGFPTVAETVQFSLADECPADTPSTLAPDEDVDLAFVMDAQGVQRYACVGSTTGYAWTFIAPDADLFDSTTHNLAIHHFAGPTWLYKDSSSVLAVKAAEATVDATAISWLLLDVTSHGGADGKLTDIVQVQRLETSGGNAPATGCDADHVGAGADVLYTARYFFYHPTTKAKPIRCGG